MRKDHVWLTSHGIPVTDDTRVTDALAALDDLRRYHADDQAISHTLDEGAEHAQQRKS